MSVMTLSEKSQTRSYGLLSARIAETIAELQKSNDLPTPTQRAVLSDGVALLEKFIIGSRLVEGDEFKDGGLLPTMDTLRAFGYAMTTLRALEQLRSNEQISSVLRAIREKLQVVQEAEQREVLSSENLETLRSFFVTLATSLCEDLIKQRFAAGVKSAHGVPTLSSNELDLFRFPNSSPMP